jgi:hypothetical protein
MWPPMVASPWLGSITPDSHARLGKERRRSSAPNEIAAQRDSRPQLLYRFSGAARGARLSFSPSDRSSDLKVLDGVLAAAQPTVPFQILKRLKRCLAVLIQGGCACRNILGWLD